MISQPWTRILQGAPVPFIEQQRGVAQILPACCSPPRRMWRRSTQTGGRLFSKLFAMRTRKWCSYCWMKVPTSSRKIQAGKAQLLSPKFSEMRTQHSCPTHDLCTLRSLQLSLLVQVWSLTPVVVLLVLFRKDERRASTPLCYDYYSS